MTKFFRKTPVTISQTLRRKGRSTKTATTEIKAVHLWELNRMGGMSSISSMIGKMGNTDSDHPWSAFLFLSFFLFFFFFFF